jgi:hypothetical protein
MALEHRVVAALSYRDAAGRHSHRRVPDGLAGTASPVIGDHVITSSFGIRLVLSHTPLAPAPVACECIEEVSRRMHGLPISLRRPVSRDIQPIKISGEDRRKYRDKVRRSLEVFARMLRERLFEASPSQ